MSDDRRPTKNSSVVALLASAYCALCWQMVGWAQQCMALKPTAPSVDTIKDGNGEALTCPLNEPATPYNRCEIVYAGGCLPPMAMRSKACAETDYIISWNQCSFNYDQHGQYQGCTITVQNTTTKWGYEVACPC